MSTAVDDLEPNGFCDSIDSGGIASGWTCDQDHPSQGIPIQFFQDAPPGQSGSVLLTPNIMFASVSNESAVTSACGGGSNHRFNGQQLPASIKGHLIYAVGLDATTRGWPVLNASLCPNACVW